MKILILGGSSTNEFKKTVLNRKVPVWGAKPTIGNAKKLVAGDLVCFFSRGKINYVAEVKHVAVGRPDLSFNIWKNKQWTTIIYLKDVVQRNISWEIARDILGYKKSYVGLRSPVLLYDNNVKFHKLFPLLKEDKWFKKQILVLDKYATNKKVSKKDFEAINELKRKVGLAGELYIVDELKKQGKNNVIHYSVKYPFAPYDVQYDENGKTVYIEVKSTIKKNLNVFYISSNEYNFYIKHKESYKVFLVSDAYNKVNNKSYRLPILDDVLTKDNMDPTSYKVKV